MIIATAIYIMGQIAPSSRHFDPMAPFADRSAWVQSDVRTLAQGNGTVRTYEHPQGAK